MTKKEIKAGLKNNIEVLDEAPKGWKKIKGAMTQPRGYEWYSNGKSRFVEEYKSCLVKIKY